MPGNLTDVLGKGPAPTPAQMSAQQKIAELERRIVALERAVSTLRAAQTITTKRVTLRTPAGESTDGLFTQLDKLMDRLFK